METRNLTPMSSPQTVKGQNDTYNNGVNASDIDSVQKQQPWFEDGPAMRYIR